MRKSRKPLPIDPLPVPALEAAPPAEPAPAPEPRPSAPAGRGRSGVKARAPAAKAARKTAAKKSRAAAAKTPKVVAARYLILSGATPLTLAFPEGGPDKGVLARGEGRGYGFANMPAVKGAITRTRRHGGVDKRPVNLDKLQVIAVEEARGA